MSENDERVALRGQKGERGRPGERGPQGDPMPRRTIRAVLALFAVAAVLAVLALLGNATLHSEIREAVQVSNHRWCATLQLLTAQPVPSPADPAANPSRENAYVFYTNLLQLRNEFSCD